MKLLIWSIIAIGGVLFLISTLWDDATKKKRG